MLKLQFWRKLVPHRVFFSIRYLGLPLSLKKIKLDCIILIDKISSGTRTDYAQWLSYAKRLKILNSVLLSIYHFWIIVFILPQYVLKEVDNMYKQFLWGVLRREEDQSNSLEFNLFS